MRRFWPLLLASLMLCGAANAEEPGAARKAELHSLVIQDCGSCHGLTMRGGLGKPLLPASLQSLSDDAIADVILEGIGGTPMPAWRGLVSEPDALWIARLLKRGVEP